MIVELPVSNAPAQSFVTQLGLFMLRFELQWNDRTSQFSMTLSNEETQQVYVEGVPLVLGTEFLEPYNYGLGALALVDLSRQSQEATLDDFGVRVKLYWFDEEEVANAINSPV